MTVTMMTTVALREDHLGNNSFNNEKPEDARSPIVSDRAMFYVDVYMHFLISGSFSVFGTANNVVNMVIFHKMGLKDSMSVGLMALSFTDFLVSLSTSVRIIFYICNMLIPDGKIDPIALDAVATGWWRDILFLCSFWITTFLSIERCVCVVFPFKVKAIFTTTRAFIIVVIIYIVHIAIHMPIFVTQWLEWTTIEVVNANETLVKKRLIAKYSGDRQQIFLYIDIANGTVLPMPAQILVLISVAWMIYGLNVSSRIRGGSKSVTEKEDPEGKQKLSSNLSSKERRLVKVVLFLACIVTLCNIPRFVAVYAKQLFPEVAFRSTDGNLYLLLWNIPILAGSINSSVNIFVYMIVNKSYRQRFKDIFCKKFQ